LFHKFINNRHIQICFVTKFPQQKTCIANGKKKYLLVGPDTPPHCFQVTFILKWQIQKIWWVRAKNPDKNNKIDQLYLSENPFMEQLSVE
jgi:hypothetical protein